MTSGVPTAVLRDGSGRPSRQAVRSLADSFARSALRQPVFAALLVLPPLMGLFIRGVPAVLTRYIPAFDPVPWMPLFLAVTAGFPPYLYGLLASLMLLDERDKDLLPALRVTPVPDRGILAARILPAAVLAMLGVPACLYISGQATCLPAWAPAAAGIVSAPLAAFYALLTVRLSSSKVQALTVGKVSGTALIAPVGLAMLPAPWRFLTVILPGTPMSAALFMPGGPLWATASLVYASVLAVWMWRSAMKSYFA